MEVLDRAIWQCPSCSEIIPTPSEATETPGESCYGIAPTSGTTLRILQLNIDSLMSKIEELKRFLKKHNIDVFVLQETKLIKNDRSPRIPGYTIIRKDRQQPKGKERNRGGGLITGIRDTIPYKHVNIEIRGAMDRLTEWLTVEIPTRKGKVRITNVYVPPVRNNRPRQQGTATPRVRDGTGVAEATVAPMNEVAESGATSTQDHRYLTRSRGVTPGEAHERGESPREGVEEEGEDNNQEVREERTRTLNLIDGEFDPRRWQCREFDIIVGDTNAHSQLWDDSVSSGVADKRGKVLENWLAVKNMTHINHGSPTHKAGTAPDTSFVSPGLLDKTEWKTVNELASDHIPIILTYQDDIPRVNEKPKYKWRLKDANWEAFAHVTWKPKFRRITYAKM